MTLLGLLAQTDGGSNYTLPEPWNYFSQYGLLIFFVFLMWRGAIRFGREVDKADAFATDMKNERDAERQARNELEQVVRDKYVPALEASRTTGEMLLKYLQSTAGLGK